MIWNFISYSDIMTEYIKQLVCTFINYNSDTLKFDWFYNSDIFGHFWNHMITYGS
jgi:hypothetical protein